MPIIKSDIKREYNKKNTIIRSNILRTEEEKENACEQKEYA